MRHQTFRAVLRNPGRDARTSLHDGARQFLQQFAQADIGPTRQWTPHVDIRETATRFVILADLPGVDPADVEVWMDKGVLSLKGERTLSIEGGEREDGEMVLAHAERGAGAFLRRFTLPDSADADAITASGRHGVLEISIPKRAEAAPRRIQVAATPSDGTRQ